MPKLKKWDDFEGLPALSQDERLGVLKGLESIERYFSPATHDEILVAISELSILSRKREGASEADFKVAVFAKAISQNPKWALSRAVSQIIREERWFPTPSQVNSIAGQHLGKARWMQFCLQQWLRVKPKPPEPEKITPEQIAAIKAEFGLDKMPAGIEP